MNLLLTTQHNVMTNPHHVMITLNNLITTQYTVADPGFQVRGGGALKNIAPSGERRENFLSISCEKSRFYAKNSFFFQF
jgi:hypothetical protein